VTLPEGASYVQHVQDGRVGNYFALPGTPAEMLGINPASRVPTTFSTAQPTSALQSTAAPIVDTWTVPGTSFNAQGGGTQFFVPNNSTLIIGK
jgi:filamentous hemagglutinin